jgi:hypothetical protein
MPALLNIVDLHTYSFLAILLNFLPIKNWTLLQ